MSHKRKQHFDDENSDDESVANMANVTRYDINNVSVETPVDNRSIDYSVALLKGAIPRDYNAETRRIDRSNLVGVDMDDQPDIVSAEGYDGQIFIPEFHVNGLIEWKREEVKLLLQKFKDYRLKVGKIKKIKNNSALWNVIAQSLNEVFDTNRIGEECYAKFSEVARLKENDLSVPSIKTELEEVDSIQQSIMNELEAAKKVAEANNQALDTCALIVFVTKTITDLAKVKLQAQERKHREFMQFLNGFDNDYLDLLNRKF